MPCSQISSQVTPPSTPPSPYSSSNSSNTSSPTNSPTGISKNSSRKKKSSKCADVPCSLKNLSPCPSWSSSEDISSAPAGKTTKRPEKSAVSHCPTDSNKHNNSPSPSSHPRPKRNSANTTKTSATSKP